MAFRASRSEAAPYGSDKQIDTTVEIKVLFANSGSFQDLGFVSIVCFCCNPQMRRCQ